MRVNKLAELNIRKHIVEDSKYIIPARAWRISKGDIPLAEGRVVGDDNDLFGAIKLAKLVFMSEEEINAYRSAKENESRRKMNAEIKRRELIFPKNIKAPKKDLTPAPNIALLEEFLNSKTVKKKNNDAK